MQFKRMMLACAGVAVLVAVPLIVSALAQENSEGEPEHDRVANLSLTEKEELRRKRDQFQRLDDSEKDRLRHLHEAIVASPDRDRLENVTLQYHEWLKTLSSEQRANLLSMTEDKKLEEIKRLMQEQRAQRLREAVETKLEPGDARAIFTWIDQYSTRHEADMLAQLPEETRTRITRMPASPMRRGMLLMALGQRPEGSTLPAPSDEELKQLADSLSPKTKAALDEAKTSDEKLKLVQGWMRAAMDSQRRPPVSNERLMEYFKERRGGLKPEELEELENLPPEQFFTKIRERFFREHRGGWGRGGHHHEGGRPPFGDGPRGGRDGDGPRGWRDGEGWRDRDDDRPRFDGPRFERRPDGPPDGPHDRGPRLEGGPREGGPRDGGPQRGFNRPPPGEFPPMPVEKRPEEKQPEVAPPAIGTPSP